MTVKVKLNNCQGDSQGGRPSVTWSFVYFTVYLKSSQLQCPLIEWTLQRLISTIIVLSVWGSSIKDIFMWEGDGLFCVIQAERDKGNIISVPNALLKVERHDSQSLLIPSNIFIHLLVICRWSVGGREEIPQMMWRQRRHLQSYLQCQAAEEPPKLSASSKRQNTAHLSCCSRTASLDKQLQWGKHTSRVKTQHKSGSLLSTYAREQKSPSAINAKLARRNRYISSVSPRANTATVNTPCPWFP